MAKFIFRLQGYLDLKEKMEDQRKLEYGRAMADWETERQILSRLREDEQSQISSLQENMRDGGVRPHEIEIYRHYLEWLSESILRQDKKTEIAAGKAEEKRIELVEAVKERKTLETLKEKARADFLREEQLAEQKIVDEIVSYQYNNAE